MTLAGARFLSLSLLVFGSMAACLIAFPSLLAMAKRKADGAVDPATARPVVDAG